jgi:alcohol dehydrogenase YqhD (iron-dependent ADH family)
MKDPENYEARAEIMWCGSLSHNGLTGCGICGGDWATHLIEHELGGMFDVAHRAGLAAVWESWQDMLWTRNQNDLHSLQSMLWE